MKKAAVIVLAGFILVSAGFGQQNTEKPKLRNEITEVKYINANWALNLLRQYMSRYGKINQIHGTNKVIIEDTPEIVDKVLTMLEEIDVKPLDLQFNVDLLLGSTKETARGELTKELKNDPVIKELKSLLKYNSFQILDSSILKVQDNSRSSQRIGGQGINLKLRLNPRYIKNEKEDSFQVELNLSQYQGFNPDGSERMLTLIDTTLTLQSGERTVIGVSKLTHVPRTLRSAGDEEADTALILILSGKVLK